MVAAGLSGFIGVAAGAFGAHGLAKRVSAGDLDIWQTASHYQLLHAVALLALVALPRLRGLRLVAWMWIAGTIIFSGSLYALVLTGIRKFGMITPIGGLCFLLGWAILVKIACCRPSSPTEISDE